MSQPGYFISIEGSEGAGKSTNIQFISELLQSKGVEVVQTREPGGTEIAEKIREILLHPSQESMADKSELLLIFAARIQHYHHLIKPALQQGQWVICDRFIDASYAYQGAARGMGVEQVASIEKFCLENCLPDLTLLFDLDPQIGLNRASSRGTLDRFEQEKLEFFEKVRRGYLSRAKQYPDRIHVINADQSVQQVQDSIKAILSKQISGWLK